LKDAEKTDNTALSPEDMATHIEHVVHTIDHEAWNRTSDDVARGIFDKPLKKSLEDFVNKKTAPSLANRTGQSKKPILFHSEWRKEPQAMMCFKTLTPRNSEQAEAKIRWNQDPVKGIKTIDIELSRSMRYRVVLQNGTYREPRSGTKDWCSKVASQLKILREPFGKEFQRLVNEEDGVSEDAFAKSFGNIVGYLTDSYIMHGTDYPDTEVPKTGDPLVTVKSDWRFEDVTGQPNLSITFSEKQD
jgi:hypothetical protein